MNRYAAIDIGTNSCRLLIAEKNKEKIIPLKKALQTTRLGEDMTKTKRIKATAIGRTIEALENFKKILEEYSVDKNNIKIYATSAAREAENKDYFLEKVKEETALEVEIISGEKEAMLSFQGAVNFVEIEKEKKPVVVDIGGGSTEFIYTAPTGLKTVSIKVGAVKCTESDMGPTDIFKSLSSTLNLLKTLEEEKIHLIGVGGTITTLAAISQKLEVYNSELIHNYTLHIEEVNEILSTLGNMSLTERKKVPGLQPERADIIVSGILILWVIMTNLDLNKITVSEADLLQGMLLEF